MSTALFETHFPGLALKGRGKVRDIYDLGDALLIVASDRISAFDVIMADPIPDKARFSPRSRISGSPRSAILSPHTCWRPMSAVFPIPCRPYAETLRDRSILVTKPRWSPSSAWFGLSERLRLERVPRPRQRLRHPLPGGLVESDRLAEPIFTPATKAELGTHDENVSFDRMVRDLGASCPSGFAH